MAKNVQGTNIFPLILGDGAFPFKTWLMKPFSHAILKREEKYFNYRLSRARMVSECAFGSLRGRWRILHRKCESKKETVKCVALACIVLHNVCIERCDVTWRKWDLSNDHTTNKRGQGQQSGNFYRCGIVVEPVIAVPKHQKSEMP